MKFSTTVDKVNIKRLVPDHGVYAIVEEEGGLYSLHTLTRSEYHATVFANDLRKIYPIRNFYVFTRKGTVLTEH